MMNIPLKRRISLILCFLLTASIAMPSFGAVNVWEVDDTSGYIGDDTSGYIGLPEENDVSSVRDFPVGEEPEDDENTGAVVLPSKYETKLRPNLRDQGNYSTCWAHSATALAEFSMISQGYEPTTVDYSEAHLAYFSYNSVTDPLGGTAGDDNCADWSDYDGIPGNIFDRAGNLILAQNILAGWVGSADETLVPYSDNYYHNRYGVSDNKAYQDRAHLRNYINVNIKSDPDNVKQLIMKNGAVGASMYYSFRYEDAGKDSYYCPVKNTTNHAITIVGWDDDFSKSNYKNTAPGDGAWLVRNSYSTVSGNYMNLDGYFWLSYYDNSMAEMAYSFEYDPADKYDHNYQYDGVMYTKSIKSDSNKEIRAANVFRVPENANESGEYLKAVSFYTEDTNEDYSIQIYKNITGANPESGTKVESASVTGRTFYAGYSTVDLAEPVLLMPGENYSVVISLYKAGKVSSFGYESKYSTVTFFKTTPSAKAGQSFLYSGGWYDYGKKYNRNIRIKAFTSDNDGGEPYAKIETISFDEKMKSDGVSLSVGDVYKAKVHVSPYNTSSRDIEWSSSNPQVASVDKDGTIKGIALGETIISAKLKNAEIGDSFKLVVGKGITLEAPTMYYGDTDVELSYRVDGGEVEDGSKVSWYISDPDILVIDEAGRASVLQIGTVYVNVRIGELVSNMIEINIYPRRVSCTVRQNDDNSVSIMWKGVLEADKYIVSIRRGSSKAAKETIAQVIGGAGTFEIRDNYYKGKVIENPTILYYCVQPGWKGRTSGATYSAIYVSEQYKISYTLGSIGENNAANPTNARYADSFTLLDPILPDSVRGYEFEGWYSDDKFENRVEKIEKTKSDVTLYAHWIQLPGPFSVSYNLCGHGINPEDNPTEFWKGESLQLYDAQEDWRTKGYSFEGWYSDSEYRHRVNSIGDSEGNIVLYAHWVPDYDGAAENRISALDDTVAVEPIKLRKTTKYLVEPVSGELTVNAGAKLYLQGIKGSYKIVADDNGYEKPWKKTTKYIVKSARVTKNGIFTAKKLKNKLAYDVTVEYERYTDSEQTEKEVIRQVIHIQNARIQKLSELPVIYSSDPESEQFSAVISLCDTSMINGEWNIKDGSYYSKRKKTTITTKQFATMEVMPDHKSVRITAIQGKRGTAVVSCTIDGVKYTTKIRIRR